MIDSRGRRPCAKLVSVTDAPQGPGWWLASDGKYYPPQPSSPGLGPAPVPDTPRKSRVWLWVLIGSFVFIGGCTAIAVVGLVALGDEISEDRKEAFEQVDCRPVGTDFSGDVKVLVAADNTTSKRSDFWVEFEIVEGAKFLGDGFASLTNIPAGVRHEEESFTNIDAPGGEISGLRCNVVNVSRFASR